MDIYGENEFDDFQRLDIRMLPCVQDLDTETCVNRSLSEITKYLQNSRLVIYENQERFNSRLYDDQSVEMTSKVVFRDFDTNQSQVIASHVKLTEFEDDSSFFQYGHAEA